MRSKLEAGLASFDILTGCAVALTVAKVVGAALNPLHFRPLTPHDDALYVRRAVQMMQGHWVGVLDQYTPMRGPLSPLCLAFVARTGLPLSIVAPLLVGALLAMIAPQAAVITLNAHYGLPARTLFDDKHFGRAHQALARY